MSDSKKKREEKLAARKRSREPVCKEQYEEWKRELLSGSDRTVAILAVANL